MTIRGKALAVVLASLCVTLAAEAQPPRTDYSEKLNVTDRLVIGGSTFGEVLRIVGAGTVSSGTGTMNPAVVDSDGDVLEDTFTTVSTAGAHTWSAAGSFTSTLAVTGATTLSSTLGVTGNTTLTGNLIGGSGTLLVSTPTRISGTAADFLLHESDAATDEKYWRLRAESDTLTLQLVSDALSTTTDVFNLQRVGMLPSDFRWGQNIRVIRGQNNAVSDLGTESVRYNQLFVNELIATTLVADERIVKTGGSQVIVEGSKLTKDLLAAHTCIFVANNSFRSGDVIHLQARLKNEKIVIGSGYTDCTVSGACSYDSAPVTTGYVYCSLTRNHDGTTANDWLEGDAIINEGQTGDPMLELLATRSTQGAGLRGQIVIDGPVAYWGMAESPSGQTIDIMGNVGVAAETGTQSTGLGFGAVGFVGATISNPTWANVSGAGYLTVTDAANLRITGDLTIEFVGYWENDFTRAENIISKRHTGEYHIDVSSNGTMQFCQGNGTLFGCASTSSGFVSVDSAHHYVVTRRVQTGDSIIDFYKDGVFTATGTITQDATSQTNNLGIGANLASVGSAEFDGYLDEVAIFNYALSPDRILAHASSRASDSISRFTRGPTAIGWVRTGTGAFDMANRWACGNLAGTDYSSNSAVSRFGCAFGDSSNTWVSIDATDGFRVMNGLVEKLKADTSGNLSLTGNLTMGTAGVFSSGTKPDCSVPFGTGLYMAYNAGNPVFCVGTPSDYVQWNGTDLTILSNNFSVQSGGVFVTPRTAETFGTEYGYNFNSSFAGDKPSMWSFETAAERAIRIDNQTTQSGRTSRISLIVDDEDSDGAGLSVRTGLASDPNDSEVGVAGINFAISSNNIVVRGNTGLNTTVVVPCGTLTFTSGVLTNKGAC